MPRKRQKSAVRMYWHASCFSLCMPGQQATRAKGIAMQDADQNVETEHYHDGPEKLFGICLTIGEDLGFDPFYLRVALIGLMVFSPVATLATYVALGGLVLAAHGLFPKQDKVSSESDDRQDEPRELPLAA